LLRDVRDSTSDGGKTDLPSPVSRVVFLRVSAITIKDRRSSNYGTVALHLRLRSPRAISKRFFRFGVTIL
jgi:hypothetical protein